MTTSPTVSVIIPTYNRSSLLERSVESVLCQKYKNFEIIIIDDASPDDTGSVIADRFSQEIESGRIKYIRNKTNKKVSTSRNIGMDESRGKYIAFLDDDDSWMPDHLLNLVGYLEDNRLIDCVFSSYKMVAEDGTFVKGNTDVIYYRGFSYSEMCIMHVISQVSSVFRKDILEHIGGFKEDLGIGQNKEFYSRLALNHAVHFIDVPTYIQFVHAGSYSKISHEDHSYNREMLLKMVKENCIKFTVILRRQVISRAYLDLAWHFLPNVRKAREYLIKSLKKNPVHLLNMSAWQLAFRTGFGEKVYLMLKKMRNIFQGR